MLLRNTFLKIDLLNACYIFGIFLSMSDPSKCDGKIEISGAIMAAPNQNDTQIRHDVPQPRQPTNLQGLLRYAMDVREGDENSKNAQVLPMDEDVSITGCTL